MRAALLFLAVLLPATTLAAKPYNPRVGERHPDFTLPSIANGRGVSLSDFLGKKVLLIHFASW